MINTTINGIQLQFETHPDLFSPREIDAGTLAMLDVAREYMSGKILDLGCGYGVVGVYAAKLGCDVAMCDISPLAVEFAMKNAALNGISARVLLSDGLAGVPDTGYSLILSNPPYHTDFSVAKRFIEKGFNRLQCPQSGHPGGRMVMVTKRRDWYKNKLIAVFGGVKIDERGGYFVFTAEKRSMKYR